MARISVVLGAVIVILCTSFASARMYFLPDYQNGAYLKRVNDKLHADRPVFTPDLRSCADYFGFLSVVDKGNMDCSIVKTFPHTGTCYSGCVCNSETYPYTSANCEHELKGGTCTDTTGKIHYERCYNPCEGLVDNDCGSYRCKTTYSSVGCDDFCKECYLNSCDYPENADFPLKADCEYGCDVQGTVEGCNSKCYNCKICIPQDCSAYPLSKCPENTICESCVVGCNDNATHYVALGCEINYFDIDAYWCSECGGGCNKGYYDPQSYWCNAFCG
ncbi:MAG: hypothetical protein E7012_06805 [Alphaproteobacteria bacterium]|nr:hypothetical protein [Alphaproteobacteria bacterium]